MSVPCRNPECPHGGQVELVTLAIGELSVDPIVPLCDGCARDEDQRERAREIARRLQRAGAPPKIQAWSFESFPSDHEGLRAKAVVQEWFEHYLAKREPGNLILVGPVGAGKTSLGWSVIRAACEQGHDAFFLNVLDYLWRCRRAISKGEPISDRPHWVGLLCIDDLGIERATEFARTEIGSLIQHRVDRRLPTVVTSNYRPVELMRRFGNDELINGERVVSRLCEGATVVEVMGPDRRLAGSPA